NSGAICHVVLVPGPGLLIDSMGRLLVATGLISSGPCTVAINCLNLTTTTGFTVQGQIGNLDPADIPVLRIPITSVAGPLSGIREVQCASADSTGTAICNAAVVESGLVVQFNGSVELWVVRATAPRTPVPPTTSPGGIPGAIMPPVGIVAPLLPPIVPVAVPPSSSPAMPPVGAAYSPEVPVIPEAESLQLVGGALLILGTLLGLRYLRRRH
ncbi:MAG TPA: hypothetical protein VKZ60_03340, partial [Chloroflexota bacterium]|nr:hypothetical protein [Chloroflexota bacterium]